jgi:hypothetical protein
VLAPQIGAFTNEAVQMASGGIIHIPSFATIRRFIQAILKLLHQGFDKLQCWWDGFMKYAVEMVSGGLLQVPGFINIVQALEAY